jgi:hypothetical protein
MVKSILKRMLLHGGRALGTIQEVSLEVGLCSIVNSRG